MPKQRIGVNFLFVLRESRSETLRETGEEQKCNEDESPSATNGHEHGTPGKDLS